jgi:hypothetical protein
MKSKSFAMKEIGDDWRKLTGVWGYVLMRSEAWSVHCCATPAMCGTRAFLQARTMNWALL